MQLEEIIHTLKDMCVNWRGTRTRENEERRSSAEDKGEAVKRIKEKQCRG